MNENSQPEYYGARFYKCALQVNPYSYGERHDKDTGASSEDDYNRKMLDACKSAGVEVVALADHGNIDRSVSLWQMLRENGIVVFPGFEIASTEKIHMVCFFPPDKTPAEMNSYLGAAADDNAQQIIKDGTTPSSLSCPKIASKVELYGGVWYAPHMDDRNGLLKNEHNDSGHPNIWQKHDLVRAGALTKDIGEVAHSIRDIIKNKNHDYKRERPIAIINANDVHSPDGFSHPRTTCWIKMTTPPTVDSLRQAFFDPESRISLNEPKSMAVSHIKSIKWSGGGFFRDSAVALSDNLNAVIGGRGAGKSSLLESIRYVLMLPSISDDIDKLSKAMVDNNLVGTTVTMRVYSQEQQGKVYNISRRHGAERSQVELDDGTISNLGIQDILPRVDILGQNEILEISKDKQKIRDLWEKFLPSGLSFANDIRRVRIQLQANRGRLLKLKRELDDIQQITDREKSVKEKLHGLEMGGIKEKASQMSHALKEKQFCSDLDTVGENIGKWLSGWNVGDSLPSPPDDWSKWPNGGAIAEIYRLFSDTMKTISASKETMRQETEKMLSEFSHRRKVLEEKWSKLQDDMNQLAGQLPVQNGGGSVIARYKDLCTQIGEIERAKKTEQKQTQALGQVHEQRKQLLAEYKKLHFFRYQGLLSAADALNKGELKGKVHIGIESMQMRDDLKEFIIAKVGGVGKTSMEWLDGTQKLDIGTLAERIRNNDSAGIREMFCDSPPTPGIAAKLVKMSDADSYELEEVAVDDGVVVSLNLAPSGTPDRFCPIDKLSPGQKCTAILSLFLLNRDSPLVLDQPEDHLDNAFIAGHIVEKIRQIKKDCQLIVSTHNANIPVFGDAELITVLKTDESGNACIKDEMLGSIDKPEVSKKTAVILDGGREAFTIRREKYGY